MSTVISPPQATPICTQQASAISASGTPLRSVLLATAHAMSANPTIPMIHHTLTMTKMMMDPPTAMPATTESTPMAISWSIIVNSEQFTAERSSRLSLANFGAGIFDRDLGNLSRTRHTLPRLDLSADSNVPSWMYDIARRLIQIMHSHTVRWSLLKAVTTWCDATHLWGMNIRYAFHSIFILRQEISSFVTVISSIDNWRRNTYLDAHHLLCNENMSSSSDTLSSPSIPGRAHPSVRSAITLARILIEDYYCYPDSSCEHIEHLRSHLRDLASSTIPNGMASVALARFSDETDDSLAARGAVVMGLSDDFDSAMMAVKSNPGDTEHRILVQRYIMLLLLTDLDIGLINKLWPSAVGNERSWLRTHSHELSWLSELYPCTPPPTAPTSLASEQQPSPVHAIPVYVPPVIAHPVSVLFPPTPGEHDAQSYQSSPPGVVHDPSMPINMRRQAEPSALSMTSSPLDVSEASFVDFNPTPGIIGNDPQPCDASIVPANNAGNTMLFAGGNSKCLLTASTCLYLQQYSCENCLRTLNSSLSNALSLVVCYAGMTSGSVTCSPASEKNPKRMLPSSPHSRI